MYLASVGFSILLVVVLRLLFLKVFKNLQQATAVLIIVAFILASVYYVSNQQEQKTWQHSGEVTKNTLLFFRKHYPSFAPTFDVYVVNTPVTYRDAWVFPVGLSDGMWFIYRNKLPKVAEKNSVDDARGSITASGNHNSYIFQFDDQANISEVK